MLFRDNPVLIRELLVTLRSPRSFVLQLLYVCALGALVYFYWPAGEEGARQVSPGVARRLFDIFFLGQFFLVALMAPTFAAGSITGEKERKTYELLLASPLRPSTILVGKLLSSLSLSGDPDRLQPAADDPLLPAGRLAPLGDHAQLPGLDPGGRDVRARLGRLLELLPPHQLGPGRQLPGHPAAGGHLRGADPHRQRACCATSSRSRSCRPGAWPPGPCWGSWSTAGCSTRPTSAARARMSSTKKRR